MEPSSKPLSYSEYINDRAIIEALRIPQPPPAGQTNETWPIWHLPGSSGGPRSVEWSPGAPWPRGRNWSHHEVIFIRTHQAFEIWFAVFLHEVDGVLRQAQEILEVEEIKIEKVCLSERNEPSKQFSPHRFPYLRRAAESFDSELLKNRVHLMPPPGRHEGTGVDFSAADLRAWAALLNRAGSALLVTIPFFDVLATMTPGQFLEFRGRLFPASGFGSTQFREIEITLGLKESIEPRLIPSNGTNDPEADSDPIPHPMRRPTEQTPPYEAMISFYRNHVPSDWPRLARRFQQPSLRDLVYGILNSNVLHWRGVSEANEALDKFAAQNVLEALRSYDAAALIDETRISDQITELGNFLSHRETNVAAMLEMRTDLTEKQSAIRSFLAACLNVDAVLLRWRDQHIRFVESMIGRRPGTGGTGVSYLRSTTDPGLATYFTHAFPCLWQAKSIIQSL